MELVSLKSFIAVVDESGIKGASEKLHTVQSNISTRVKRLEEELGVKLFELKGRKLKLTTSGKTLYDYAERMIHLEHQAKNAIELSKGSYELRIGVAETFAAVHLPKALQSLHKSHSHIQCKIHTATSGELIKAVRDDLVDCAFIGGQVDHKDLVSLPAVKEQMVLVAADGRDSEPVLIVRGEGCGYRKIAQAWQQETGRSGEQLMVMSSVDGVLGCIAAGLGYTAIGIDNVVKSRYEDSLVTEPLTGNYAYVNISLVHRRDTVLKSGIDALASFFQTE